MLAIVVYMWYIFCGPNAIVCAHALCGETKKKDVTKNNQNNKNVFICIGYLVVNVVKSILQ